MRKGVQLAGLCASGLLAGNELGTLVGFHPALRTLSPRAEIESEQALTGRLGKVMPFWMTATLAATTAAAADRAGDRGFGPAAAAAGATATMLAVTLAGNVPLNRRTMAHPPEGGDAEEWSVIRRRWERLHALRVALDLAALGCLAAAALRDR